MFLHGDRVQITPQTPDDKKFWAFVDGWTGTVTGINMGNVIVTCERQDGQKTFFVPPANLTKLAKIA